MKAQVSVAVLLLIIIAVCGSALYYAAIFKSITPDAVNIGKSADMFENASEFEFYAKDFASFALQEAYAEVVNKPTACKQLALIQIWDDSCYPNNQEIRNKLNKSFYENFAAIGDFKSDIKDKLNVVIERDYITSDSNKIFFYNESYNQIISFSLDYPTIDFEQIYSKAVIEKDKLLLDNWDVSVSSNESSEYHIFTLDSKKLYLYDNSYKPVELKFALHK